VLSVFADITRWVELRGGSPLYRERVGEPDRERKADQDDERPEQLAPGRVLAAHEPEGFQNAGSMRRGACCAGLGG
jgi:hypothetical protein